MKMKDYISANERISQLPKSMSIFDYHKIIDEKSLQIWQKAINKKEIEFKKDNLEFNKEDLFYYAAQDISKKLARVLWSLEKVSLEKIKSCLKELEREMLP